MRWGLLLLALTGCGTLADAGGGDRDVPNALAGPFRELAALEVGAGRVAPEVLRDKVTSARDAAVLDADGDPSTLEVVSFSIGQASDGSPAVVRHRATDGRSFERLGEVVLLAEPALDGARFESPSALRVADEVWLYVANERGVVMAVSRAGGPFERREGAPVLAPATSGWDAGLRPESPTVVRTARGWNLFYSAGGALGEALSDDGLTWIRATSPALTPLAQELALDAPAGVVSRSPLGRELVWLYHVARRRDGARVVEVAARAGEDEPFVRGASPVFVGDAGSVLREPGIVRFDGFSLLYVTDASAEVPSLLGGVAPADALLPPPAP
ncbi:MAG: hypothetical protein FJ095_06140 [Deltaproteobacteria bacterium]|nr:hypothetical protein [Deltaproteobacteria bacterium]